MKHGWMEMGEGEEEEDIEGSRRKATIEEEAEETERRKSIEFVKCRRRWSSVFFIYLVFLFFRPCTPRTPSNDAVFILIIPILYSNHSQFFHIELLHFLHLTFLTK
ncbi:hypothetical protein V8G54_000612 [Vigna mungo]|uniref:Uncharacterized protein n=1 Tax=Vigna mungo TaxID=3915 RepID=A0AAQ3SA47_VIGMU